MTVAAIRKLTPKVAICFYVNKMVLTATMAKYKLQVAPSIPNIIAVIRTTGLAVKPSQINITIQSVEL